MKRLLFALLAAAILVAAFVVQAQDTRVVEVDGHGMRVLTSGLEDAQAGAAIVVLEAGFMLDGISAWTSVFDDIAQFSPVVAYDRAGIGGSEEDGVPPTARHVAENLHALLAELGAQPPYLLVGHSLGGPFIRMFTALYPDEVAGLLYVDPTATMSEDEQREMDAAMGVSAEDRMRRWDELPEMPTPGTRAERRLVVESFESHWPDFQDLPPVPDVPVTVLMASRFEPSPSRGIERDCAPRECHARAVRVRMAWLSRLTSEVTNGTLTVVTNSGHFIQNDDPDLVVWSVRRILESESPRRLVELDLSVLEGYVGVYEAMSGARFSITLEDGQIFGQVTGQGPVALFPVAKDEFFVRIVDARVSFVRDGSGSVSRLILRQNGRDTRWERVR